MRHCRRTTTALPERNIHPASFTLVAYMTIMSPWHQRTYSYASDSFMRHCCAVDHGCAQVGLCFRTRSKLTVSAFDEVHCACSHVVQQSKIMPARIKYVNYALIVCTAVVSGEVHLHITPAGVDNAA